MDFSIIVPVRNRPREIERCVQSLLALDYDPAKFEVLVIDNGSTDDTAKVAEASGARVLSEPQPNRCNARNLGAAEAQGQWLAFTDSDCEVDADWLKNFAGADEKLSGEIGILAGAVLPGPAESPAAAYIARRGWIDQEKFLTDEPFSPPFAATANLAIRKEVFDAVGGFDPALSVAGEDADWCWRARESGWHIRYVAEARIVHHHRATTGQMIRQAYDYGQGNAALFAKYRNAWGARRWVDFRHWGWAAKGLAKAPVGWAVGGNPLDKREAWYDFLTNSAQAAGRLRGGLRRGILII